MLESSVKQTRFSKAIEMPWSLSYSRIEISIHRVGQKVSHRLMAYFCQILTDLQKFLTAKFLGEFAVK